MQLGGKFINSTSNENNIREVSEQQKMTDEKSEEPFWCSHCESLGEIPFSCFQRQHQEGNRIGRIWVRNLPDGIQESGVKNLFLTVGKPTAISFHPGNNYALVEFKFMNEAELAIRDLHGKPPYNLKVSIARSRSQNDVNKDKDKEKTQEFEAWDFSQQEELKDETQYEVDDSCLIVNSKVNYVRNLLGNLSYDPSVRIRQNKFDFKTDYECISIGRGYIFRGKTDNFVGGLQKFELSSENSKSKDEMKFYCENCQALTTKICGRCSASYCSKTCLSMSSIDHKTCRNLSDNEISQKVCSDSSLDSASDKICSQIPFDSGCTVMITTYLTMQKLFVRRIEENWEEQFARLCNDVASEAYKGGTLENLPEVDDTVIAKYHEDLSYYRARVISHISGKVNLFFVDFGNAQETDLEDLKPLPDYLKTVQPFAVMVSMKGVSKESSPDSVNYYNTLTADRIPLIMEFESGTSEVVLIERDSKAVVNETVAEYALPSWKREGYVFSKSGQVFYLNAIQRGRLEIGIAFNFMVSHFDEKEFLDSGVFWVTKVDTDDFLHANSEMYLRIREYCEFLKNDYYLPRENELCLAKEGGEWHRCVNLKSHGTTCCLFFLDDGHFSPIGTNNIRKMIEDFTEVPSQAVCCTFPDDSKLKDNKELQSVAVKYLKESVGQVIKFAVALKRMKDTYCLSIPQINEILSQTE